MPPKSRRNQAVDRNVHFYRADTGADAAGRPVPLDLSAALSAIEALPFSPLARGGRYLGQPDGDDLCLWVDSLRPPQRIRLARLRRNALPQTEAAGRLSAVQLAANASLYEAIHILLLPDNVVAVEFNFYGPRASRLPDYLEQVVGGSLTTPFVMEQILRQDAADQLDRQRGLRMLDLRIRPSYAATVAAAAPSLGRALTSAVEAGQSDVVGLFLEAEPRQRSARLDRDFLTAVRSLARRRDLRDNAMSFKVRGVNEAGRVEPIDVLSDALVSVQKVAKQGARSRAVDSDSAYAAISAAYDEATQLQLLVGPGTSVVR